MSLFDQFVRGDFVNPATLLGAAFYAFLFMTVAWFLSRMVRLTVHRFQHLLIDQTVSTLLIRLAQVLIYVMAAILYTHAIPQLRSVGTALLTSAGVASILFGLAAQSTLSNLVSGFALLLYQPFEMGDKVQVAAPSGLETGVVAEMTMGYIIIQTENGREIVVPNSVAATQVVVRLVA
ncbi:MAG: hypothetical protein OJF47_002864 [Nitrospira sp.]|jgi:small-conductance mechanosensitive channel|nr:MAG: hypothetical protein OJF47_002864 [Nitrospira sp.]